MKILFTGGGTGGHFYPIIAVAEAIKAHASKSKLIPPDLYFLAPDPYSRKILFDNQIKYYQIPAGKMRIYSSVENFFDMFKTGIGVIAALWRVFWIYPDVIFSKGGYGSFPVVLAGHILGIPIVVHESDSTPGRANSWAAKYADKIAVSYPDAAKFFDEKKVAWTGSPVRKEVAFVTKEGAKQFLNLEDEIPVILVLGGSQGAKLINDLIIDILPQLVEKFQIIHQTGKANFKEVKETADMVLNMSQYASRYKPFDYLDDLAMRMASGSTNLVISRAGSTIFEIALWGVPSILIPITDSNGDHQRKNAYNYARSGGAVVIEEANLNKNILMEEIERIFKKPGYYQEMVEGAKSFAKPEAADKIAQEIINTALTHEK
jgi:UDP-N-acetylglucosamine--N-acetylmuramyl-(pentapeptide) pyrophosphoryl-undecaprenol N-acetylglucosamine transferase